MPLPLKQNNFNGKVSVWKLDNCDPGSNKKIEAVDVVTRDTAFLEPAAPSDRARELTLSAKENSHLHSYIKNQVVLKTKSC